MDRGLVRQWIRVVIFSTLTNILLDLSFSYLWKMKTLFFPPTQPLKCSREQQGGQGTWSFEFH